MAVVADAVLSAMEASWWLVHACRRGLRLFRSSRPFPHFTRRPEHRPVVDRLLGVVEARRTPGRTRRRDVAAKTWRLAWQPRPTEPCPDSRKQAITGSTAS